jgi:hypothetical protein
MSTPTTTNTVANEVNTIIKGIENVCVPLIENAIITAVPALGLPVIKQITEEIEQIFANYLTKWAEEQADFAIIDTQVSSEEAAIAQKGQSDAAFQDTQSALVNDSGSGTLK